ncbi:MAG: hypothetical protein E6I56_07895 [Chloroflexi bacterium]|nr:MAG: hypothetical protein E6I56_07895 [Chloroflexota bacterium]
MNNGLVRKTVWLSAAGAATVLIAGLALGQARNSLALAVGLLIGSLNGLMVQRSLALGMAFSALSLVRLLLLTAVGIGIGLLIGLAQVWLVVVGIGVAQLVLAGWAVREAIAK